MLLFCCMKLLLLLWALKRLFVVDGGGWFNRERSPSMLEFLTDAELDTGVATPKMFARELSPEPEMMALLCDMFSRSDMLIPGAKSGPKKEIG